MGSFLKTKILLLQKQDVAQQSNIIFNLDHKEKRVQHQVWVSSRMVVTKQKENGNFDQDDSYFFLFLLLKL